jgi:hypothetical protein
MASDSVCKLPKTTLSRGKKVRITKFEGRTRLTRAIGRFDRGSQAMSGFAADFRPIVIDRPPQFIPLNLQRGRSGTVSRA